MEPSVSAVVVHYRGRQLLARSLESCLAIDLIGEVIVVDNERIGADLRSAFQHPRIRVIQMPHNLGYGRAANAGLEAARHDAALVLNQDVELQPDAVVRLLEAGLRTGAWVAGPLLVGPDGLATQSKTGFPSPLSWDAPCPPGPGWRWAPWISGAAMLFLPGHRDLRFEPRFFMYAEDEELCWRVWKAGGRVVQVEGARVRHEGGTATSWGRQWITARTLANRARMVAWHAGWKGLASFISGEVIPRAVRRASAGKDTTDQIDQLRRRLTRTR